MQRDVKITIKLLKLLWMLKKCTAALKILNNKKRDELLWLQSQVISQKLDI